MSRVQRLVRGLGLDRNPLRRRSDKVAAWLGAGLIAAFLAGAPLLSLAAANWTGHLGAVEQRAQRSWHRVTAVLLHDAPMPATLASTLYGGAWVPARWAAPGGRVRTGEIDVATGLTAGQQVPIWVDSAGTPTGPPLTSQAVAARSVAAAAIAPMVLGIVVAFVAAVARWMLDRRRLAGWASAWASVGPVWTKRFWSRG